MKHGRLGFLDRSSSFREGDALRDLHSDNLLFFNESRTSLVTCRMRAFAIFAECLISALLTMLILSTSCTDGIMGASAATMTIALTVKAA
jgi:hypothetical protein